MIIKIGTSKYLIGSKTTRKDKKTDPVKEILTTFSKGLNPVRDKNAYERAKYTMETVKSNFETGIQGLVEKLGGQEMTSNQFKHHARILFKESYYKAYEVGTEATGLNLDYFKLPDNDYKWLDKIRSEEYKYLENFINDIENDTGKMDYQKRSELYGEKLDSIFNAGRVDAMPSSGTSIHWILGASEELCPDCISLAGGSPYTRDELPTTPKAGDTRCLFNCNCRLRIDYETPEESYIKIQNYSGNMEEDIDWNIVDRTMTILYEQQELESTEYGLSRIPELLEEFNEVTKKLHIDPFSRDFVLIHRLGAYVRKHWIGGIE